MLPREEWVQKMLALPEKDRAYVADALEQSLHSTPMASEVANAWSQEIDRRIAAYDRGETSSVDFKAAVQHMRKALAEHKQPKAFS